MADKKYKKKDKKKKSKIQRLALKSSRLGPGTPFSIPYPPKSS